MENFNDRQTKKGGRSQIMNYEKIYKLYVRSVFSDECHDIVRAIMYIQKRFYNMPREFQNANKELDNQTKNRIIQSILRDDEMATKYKLCRV